MFFALQLVLRATPFGLRMRAVTQNRRMASAMGISTSLIDMLAFGLGSGIAGIAGVALSQIDNVSPNLGQGYIIDSFMVVVLGGVGNLWGTLLGALSLGLANKLLEPFIGAVLAKSCCSSSSFCSSRSARAACSRSRAERSRPEHEDFAFPARSVSASSFSSLTIGVGDLDPVLALAPAKTSAFYVPPYVVALLGKYVCYAILAVALDLVWGYCGILSLGHGAFFALGGYAMGMYLMRQIGARGVYANPILPDFMVFLNWKELPVAWWGFNSFRLCGADDRARARPARLRLWLVRVPLAGDGRLSLDHHPGDDLCAEARILPQRFRLWRQQRPDRFQGHSRHQRAGGFDPRRAVFHLGAGAGARLCRRPRRSSAPNTARR